MTIAQILTDIGAAAGAIGTICTGARAFAIPAREVRGDVRALGRDIAEVQREPEPKTRRR